MRYSIIKNILYEKKKKRKKTKSIIGLYSLVPIFFDTISGTSEDIEENFNLSKKNHLSYRYFDIHICRDPIYNENLDEYECEEGYSVFCKIPQKQIMELHPITSEEQIGSRIYDRDEAWPIIKWALKNKKISNSESNNIDYVMEINEEEYQQLIFGKYQNDLNEIEGLSDTLGANTSQNIPKWEDGINRGPANPIDSKKSWQSGIIRGHANSLF